MKHNLIPLQYAIREEAGIQVNDTPKVHVKEPTVDDHSTGFRIPLQVWVVFSCFASSKPSRRMY